MLEIVQAGGWIMLPIIVCSIAAVAIILERLWILQPKRVVPRGILAQVQQMIHDDQLDQKNLQRIYRSSPVGQLLATALANRFRGRDIIKESVEDCGRHIVHDLERYLRTLGTIASISPLLGLLGTVIGMIKVFAALMATGGGSPGSLAGGISEALITTAAGLSVAIPALIGYQYLRGRVEALVVQMEKEAMKFLETALAQTQIQTGPRSAENEPPTPIKRTA